MNNLSNYELMEEREIKDINSKGLLFRHKKSGARIAVLSNDDENKVFSIAFRTPPEDFSGTPHIIEHTVLCGSDKFPAKDPFVELVKGSLNTFLNAMTYPDKTMFPIASCNDTDFQNLMDVYMDAVLNPNIYKREEIFKQEGWHYELENKDAAITLNGVVYNEMKGAYSSADEILSQKVNCALFPDTTYSKDSGGDPEYIPELTYEKFLDFHRKYYHPSNSYIYLYGDMNVEEKLNWLDKEYLSKYDSIEVDSEITLQKPFDRPVEVTAQYPIASEESEEDKTYISYNTVLGTNLNKEHYIAFDILDYALLSTPGAPLRQALLDAGIGNDISGGCNNSTYQQSFSIEARNTNADKKEKFLKIIRDVLTEQVEKGINKKALLAGINSFEFKFRESDFGQFPKGLLYGIQCMDSWLYDETKPFLHIEALDTFKYLREQVETETGYFEKLVKDYILDNPHTAVVILEPKKGLNNENEEKLKAELARYKESLSEEEIEQLVKDTAALKQYQDEPSTKEELDKIPMLTREDMKKEALPINNEIKDIDGIKILHHNMFSNGINYLNLMFDMKNISQDELVYVGILKSVLGYVDTDNFSYGEYANEVDLHTGGIYTALSIYANANVPDEFELKYEVKAKAVYDKLPKAMELIHEMICTSKLDDMKRLKEIIAEKRSRLQDSISASGNAHSAIRAMSYFSKSEKVNDLASGIGFYLELKDMDDNFEARKDEISAKLKELTERIFRKENLMVGCTANDEGYVYLEKELPALTAKLFTEEVEKRTLEIKCEKLNEAFKDASKVQYVSRAGDFRAAGHEYNGALKILKVMLSYDYLWINVRVKGGAYGCGSSFLRNGRGYFSSYRDPNLEKTNEIYNNIPDYIRGLDIDERDMTKYIIGTFSDMDTPLNPSAKGARSEAAYLCNITYDMIQKERDQVLTATQEDIRALAGIVEAILANECICVIGNEEKIEEQKNMFDRVISL